MSNKNEIKPVDAIIEDDIKTVEGKNTTVKSILKIAFNIAGARTNKALRVYDKNNQVILYASVRTNTLETTDEGYQANVTAFADEMIGKHYDLTEVGTKIIVAKGKIVRVPAAAEKIVNLKTVNEK